MVWGTHSMLDSDIQRNSSSTFNQALRTANVGVMQQCTTL